MALTADTAASPLDRLGFCLFLALAVHGVAILGIGFEPEPTPRAERTLEVTLAAFEAEEAPDKADFIAQKNQQGSGASDQVAAPSSRQQADFQSNSARPLAARPQPQPRPEPEVQTRLQPEPAPEPLKEKSPAPPEPDPADAPERLTTQAQAAEKQAPARTTLPPKQQAPSGSATAMLARSMEIAALEAKLDVYAQANARQPRVRRLYSASTRESFDARYLDTWRRKVERIGNLNYPEEARRRNLHGYLRLLVVIDPEGQLKRVEVLKSSGEPVLDEAARRIVRLAAPFAPFPPELRRRADMVEIIRTWKFERARLGVNG